MPGTTNLSAQTKTIGGTGEYWCWQVPVPPGATGFSVAWTLNQTGSAPIAAYDREYTLNFTSGYNVGSSSTAASSSGSTSKALTPIGGEAIGHIELGITCFGYAGPSSDVTFAATVINWTGATTDCAYGTRLQAGRANNFNIDAGIVDTVLSPFQNLQWLGWGLETLVGWTVNAGNLCNGPPPDMPAFSSGDFLPILGLPTPGTIGKFLQAFQALAWPVYCECIPATGGDPPAVGYPAPAVPSPPDSVPLAPFSFVCDDTDICSSINLLMRLLQLMNSQMQLLRLDVQLIQRQAVPFAYNLGTSFPGLSGRGELAVQGILGLSVTFSAIGQGIGRNDADPVDYFDLGEVSLGTAEGWESRHLLRHSPEVLLNVSPAITRVGYRFEPGCTATIQLLVREL